MKLKNIIHYIGLLGFFICNLLGGLLYGYPLLMMLPLSLVMVFVVFYLVRLMINKKKETHTKIVETLSHWFIYLLIMIAGSIVSLHFITVQFIAIDEFENNGKDKLDAIDEISKEFQKQIDNTYSELYSEIQKKLNEYVNVSSSDKKILEDDLLNVYNIKSVDLKSRKLKDRVKEITSSTLESYYTNQIDKFWVNIKGQLNNYSIENRNVFVNMDYLNVNKVYYELDTVFKNNKKRLEDGFNKVVSQYGKDIDVFNDLSIPESSVSLNNFTKLREQYPPWKYLLFYLLLHLLIISPLLLARKEGKRPLSEEDIYTKEL